MCQLVSVPRVSPTQWVLGETPATSRKTISNTSCLESDAGSGLVEMDLGAVVSKLKGICGDTSASNLDKGPNSKHTVNKSLFEVRANCTN